MVQSKQPTSEYASTVSFRDDAVASELDRVGTYFLGRYRVVDEIGVGGMASVHLARMDGAGGFQKWVAIKRIHRHLIEDEHFINMFLDEARIAARISHPNVAQVFDLGVQDGTYWIAMEYLHGEPLRELMRLHEENATRTAPELASRIVADAAEGLHAAHELRDKDGNPLNLVHRDVSPHNLFVTYDGMVKVVDFGIAKVSDRLSSTRAGTLKGKLAYMSPEQVRGAAIDRRTDIFALGVVLWEMVVGRRLFRMESDLETLERVQSCVVPPPSSLVRGFPQELEAIIQKALDKRADNRFQTARELSRALQQFLIRTGKFVGSEEVRRYVQSLFYDRIRQRDEHLRWAADVTQTVSLDSLSGEYLDLNAEEISLQTIDDEENIKTRRDVSPSIRVVPSVSNALQATINERLLSFDRQPSTPADLPPLPPVHAIHLPAPRVPPEIVNPPTSSVMINAGSSRYQENNSDHNEEEDDDDQIATIIALPRVEENGELGLLPMVPFVPPYARGGQPLAPPGSAAMGSSHYSGVTPSQSAPMPTVPPPPRTHDSAARRLPPHSFSNSSRPVFPVASAPAYMPIYARNYQSSLPHASDTSMRGYNATGPGVASGATAKPPHAEKSSAVKFTAESPVDPVHERIMRQNRILIYVAAGLGGLFVISGLFAVFWARPSVKQQLPSPPYNESATVVQPGSIATDNVTVVSATNLRPVASALSVLSAQPPGTASAQLVATATAQPAVATPVDKSSSGGSPPLDPARLPTVDTVGKKPPKDAPAPNSASQTTHRTKRQPSTDSAPTVLSGSSSGTTSKPGTSDSNSEPSGFLTVVCTPFCNSVKLDSRSLGPSPIVAMPLAPGNYAVKLFWASGTTKVMSANIRSGKKSVIRSQEK